MGRDHPNLLGEVGINVGFAEQERSHFCVRPRATVDQNEVCFAQGSIVEHGIEQARVGTGNIEVSTATGASVDMDGQLQTSGLASYGAKQEILKLDIIDLAWITCFDISRKDSPGFVLLRFGEVQRA